MVGCCLLAGSPLLGQGRTPPRATKGGDAKTWTRIRASSILGTRRAALEKAAHHT